MNLWVDLMTGLLVTLRAGPEGPPRIFRAYVSHCSHSIYNFLLIA